MTVCNVLVILGEQCLGSSFVDYIHRVRQMGRVAAVEHDKNSAFRPARKDLAHTMQCFAVEDTVPRFNFVRFDRLVNHSA